MHEIADGSVGGQRSEILSEIAGPGSEEFPKIERHIFVFISIGSLNLVSKVKSADTEFR